MKLVGLVQKRIIQLNLLNCKWVNIASEAIRTLGIYNSYDTDLVEKLNFLDNLKPLNDVIRTWEPRGLSLAGKILVFKTLAVSKLLYVCTFKNPSTQIIESLNSVQKKFSWSKKRPKIEHPTLISDYKDGGYKDIDIETKISSLKVKWVSRLLDDNFHTKPIFFKSRGQQNNLPLQLAVIRSMFG